MRCSAKIVASFQKVVRFFSLDQSGGALKQCGGELKQ